MRTVAFAAAVAAAVAVPPAASGLAAPAADNAMSLAALDAFDSVASPVTAAPPVTSEAGATVPNITGPIRVTRNSHPFGGAAYTAVPENLAEIGYVEEEYFISGLANVYTWPAPGPAVIRTADAPYTTRILVRRPAKEGKFSGNVVVEPLNPSNLFDLNLGWGLMHEELIRKGDVWVGVTVKPVSMQTLKTFDPKRYAALSMDNPLPLSDPANCSTVPADSSRSTENGLAWDIYSQVGELLRSKSAKNPVAYGDRKLKKGLTLYGFGYSQTGGYMYDYINAVAPLAKEQTGRSTYDGYIVAVAGGAFAGIYPINQCEPVPAVDDPRRQLSNVGVPVMHVMSQSDYLRGITSRRPDSDWPSDRYRGYEMAGAGHATPTELEFAALPEDIIKGGRDVPPMECNEGPRSRFPSSIFFDAILHNLDLWVRKDVPPPHGSPIVVQNGQPVLDEFGNVQGGLRSPYVDVPTSTWNGTSTGASFCFIAGHEIPFSAERLRELYPTHSDYVRAVVRDTRALVKQGFITGYDGRMLIREAQRADVPPAS
ncbi:alpha/beta hydrolase domain-containing protein [Nakamurella sp. GG22]